MMHTYKHDICYKKGEHKEGELVTAGGKWIYKVILSVCIIRFKVYLDTTETLHIEHLVYCAGISMENNFQICSS